MLINLAVSFFITKLTWGALGYVLLAKHFTGYQIEKNEMGGACGTYGEQQEYVQNVSEET